MYEKWNKPFLKHGSNCCRQFGTERVNSFSAKGNIDDFANNADSGEPARNELSHLKSALFAFYLLN